MLTDDEIAERLWKASGEPAEMVRFDQLSTAHQNEYRLMAPVVREMTAVEGSVTVPLEALRALVEAAKVWAQSEADEWGMGDADDPANVKARTLVEALGVEGL